MSDELPTANMIKAKEMIANSPATLPVLSPNDQTMIEDALALGLDDASQRAVDNEARVTKLEGQVHSLSDAIIVIAEPSDAVDGAVQMVKDNM